MASSVIMAQIFNASTRNDGSGSIQEAEEGLGENM